MAADPCCRNHDHPEYPLSAPCRRKRCTYAVLSFCGGSDFADNFYFIHIPGNRNLCQYTGGTLQKCISAGIYAFPHNDRHCVITIFPLYMTYLDAKLQPLYACCWFFFGFGLVAFINSMLLYRFFKKLLPPEEDYFAFVMKSLGKLLFI